MRHTRRIRKIVKVHSPDENSLNSPSRINKGNVNKKNVTKLVAPIKVNKQPKKVNIPERHNMYSKVTPIWKGDTVFIIGGGPSLKGFDWSSLIRKKTIAINKAIQSYPNPNVLYWTDGRVYTWLKNDIDSYKGLKYTLRRGAHYDNTNSQVHVLKRGRKFGLETALDTLAHGNNSGYAAINLAIHLGAKRIILLGYDMGSDGTESHFHDGYPINATSHKIYKEQFMPGFDLLAQELKGSGIQVFNASPTSKLIAFPKISIEKALEFR